MITGTSLVAALLTAFSSVSTAAGASPASELTEAQGAAPMKKTPLGKLIAPLLSLVVLLTGYAAQPQTGGETKPAEGSEPQAVEIKAQRESLSADIEEIKSRGCDLLPPPMLRIEAGASRSIALLR